MYTKNALPKEFIPCIYIAIALANGQSLKTYVSSDALAYHMCRKFVFDIANEVPSSAYKIEHLACRQRTAANWMCEVAGINLEGQSQSNQSLMHVHVESCLTAPLIRTITAEDNKLRSPYVPSHQQSLLFHL